MKKKQIFAIEPFYGGSHRLWLDQLCQNTQHEVSIYSHPERFWKWRMNGAAITLSQEVNRSKLVPDLFLVSDMLDLATFKGLLKPEFRNVPCLSYFHENQLTYPHSQDNKHEERKRDAQYSFKNITSALSADGIAFNSLFHKEDFIKAIRPFLKQFPDCLPKGVQETIERKSIVLPLGVENAPFIRQEKKESAPVILWNHRWEHDKNPEAFFKLCFKLDEQNTPFQLIVLGERNNKYPQIFDLAKEKLFKQIIQFGAVQSKEEYWSWLAKSHYLPVTSNQDFFGISLIEAMSAGVIPLAPKRLVFPEHLKGELSELLYTGEQELLEKLSYFLNNSFHKQLSNQSIQYAQQYQWEKVISLYEQCFKSYFNQ